MKKKLVSLLTLVTLSLSPMIALAADSPDKWIEGIINRSLSYVFLPLFSGLVVIMLIYAGITFVTAQGDPSKVATAKKTVIWVCVGIVIALLSYAIIGFVKTIIKP